MAKELKQTSLFEENTSVVNAYQQSVHDLEKPINDHARMIYTLLQHRHPVDFMFIAKKYGLIKFQTRLAEILRVYPSIVTKTKEEVPKASEKRVDVTKYMIPESLRQRVMKFYQEVLNVEGASGKIIRGDKHSDFADL
jgi:hypothetical protein